MRKPITIATNYEEDGSDSLSSTVANSTQAYNEDNSPYSFTRNAQLSDSESLLDESRKIRKKREVYSKISDEIRLQLLESVQNGETLKSAAKRFNVNYSSAKSILHTYRKEGRIHKKSAQERNLKKKGEDVAETKKSSSKKASKKVEAEPVEFDHELAQEFINYDENMMAKLTQAGLEEQEEQTSEETSMQNQVQDVDAFLVKGDNEADYGYIASKNEGAYEKIHEDFAEFVDMPVSFESEGTFFDPCMFLTFKDNAVVEEKDNKRFYEDDWENPINCSLKSFLGAQNMFGSEIRINNSFCHDDNDSGFRKGSIDLF